MSLPFARVLALVGICIAALVGATGCGVTKGSGKITTESRPVSGFSAVTLAGSGQVVVTQGDTEALTVEAEDNLLPLIETTVQGETLTIDLKRGEIVQATKPMVYRITLRNLTRLGLSGSGTIRSDSLKADALAIDLSGSGSIKLQGMDVGSLQVELGGSGSIDLSGRASNQDVSLSGSGSYKATDLQSAGAQVGISGSGSVTLWATDSLTTSISGSGSIGYYGTPKVTSTSSGSGSVKSLGAKAAQ